MHTGGSYPGVKRPLREADYSLPSSAEVEDARSYTSIAQYVFMAWCLIRYSVNFIFTFPIDVTATNLVLPVKN
jgi:hypothetical protein